MALLLGWQFTAAEFVGGPIMIVLIAVLFRLFLRQHLVDLGRRQADRGLAGSMDLAVAWNVYKGVQIRGGKSIEVLSTLSNLAAPIAQAESNFSNRIGRSRTRMPVAW